MFLILINIQIHRIDAYLHSNLVGKHAYRGNWRVSDCALLGENISDGNLLPLHRSLERKPGWTSFGFSSCRKSMESDSLMALLLSDFIVTWRAWILWPEQRFLKTVLIVLMVTNCAMQFCQATYDTGALSSTGSRPITIAVDMAGLGMTLGVNLFTTILIGIKAWVYWQRIRSLRLPNSRLSPSQRILLFWIESGTIFCFVQALYTVVLCLGTIPGINYAVTLMNIFLTDLMPILAGIYPVAVAIMVRMELSVTEDKSTFAVCGPSENNLELDLNTRTQ
ncbi:hypothetical protein GYMLUDRAFT_266231 [Collybiopsis luxurians FD-317 M1]|uniref:Uncharacterized protein n=1 Tax=Collybiopsis luxurians FD-317 M1 TaxID=944289 RepID=A0A0D0B7P7_9AGAR|nr:hypothetical protein GYMLUDRAFT_266231 [Collybiopsis luxurians FD-317 M1]